MENTKLLFYGTEKSETDNSTLEVNANILNDLVIEIKTKNSKEIIVLNRQTSIKLSKELKKQISKLS